MFVQDSKNLVLAARHLDDAESDSHLVDDHELPALAGCHLSDSPEPDCHLANDLDCILPVADLWNGL